MSSVSHPGFILYILSPFIVTVFNVYMVPKRYHFVVFVVESPQCVYTLLGDLRSVIISLSAVRKSIHTVVTFDGF